MGIDKSNHDLSTSCDCYSQLFNWLVFQYLLEAQRTTSMWRLPQTTMCYVGILHYHRATAQSWLELWFHIMLLLRAYDARLFSTFTSKIRCFIIRFPLIFWESEPHPDGIRKSWDLWVLILLVWKISWATNDPSPFCRTFGDISHLVPYPSPYPASNRGGPATNATAIGDACAGTWAVLRCPGHSPFSQL